MCLTCCKLCPSDMFFKKGFLVSIGTASEKQSFHPKRSSGTSLESSQFHIYTHADMYSRIKAHICGQKYIYALLGWPCCNRLSPIWFHGFHDWHWNWLKPIYMKTTSMIRIFFLKLSCFFIIIYKTLSKQKWANSDNPKLSIKLDSLSVIIYLTLCCKNKKLLVIIFH